MVYGKFDYTEEPPNYDNRTGLYVIVILALTALLFMCLLSGG